MNKELEKHLFRTNDVLMTLHEKNSNIENARDTGERCRLQSSITPGQKYAIIFPRVGTALALMGARAAPLHSYQLLAPIRPLHRFLATQITQRYLLALLAPAKFFSSLPMVPQFSTKIFYSKYLDFFQRNRDIIAIP